MSANGKPPVLVVVQLSGGNDFMNTVVPYTSGVYHDSRPTVGLDPDEVLPIDDTLGFHPSAGPLKELFDQGDMAVVQGVGYPNPSRSHFRGMDVWHTCEPDRVVTEGWLGKTVRELDGSEDNPLTAVNFGRGLPRALAAPGVPVTSVSDLDSYGLMTGISSEEERRDALRVFKEMYAPAIGSGPAMEYVVQTGLNVLDGAELLKQAPARYTSEVEYAGNPIAKSLRDVARVHLADLGTRILYTSHGGYDTHSHEVATHRKLLSELSGAIMDFFQDLRDHDASEEVVMLVFTEFGRRIKDNGSGTDHGSGGGAYIIGDRVRGGLYAEYPSLDPGQWENGEDLRHTIDFRGVYGTILEQWLEVEPAPVVGGAFEQVPVF